MRIICANLQTFLRFFSIYKYDTRVFDFAASAVTFLFSSAHYKVSPVFPLAAYTLFRLIIDLRRGSCIKGAFYLNLVGFPPSCESSPLNFPDIYTNIALNNRRDNASCRNIVISSLPTHYPTPQWSCFRRTSQWQ